MTVVESGTLQKNELSQLLASLTRYPQQEYWVRLWAVEKSGAIRIRSGQVESFTIEDASTDRKETSPDEFGICNYRILTKNPGRKGSPLPLAG